MDRETPRIHEVENAAPGAPELSIVGEFGLYLRRHWRWAFVPLFLAAALLAVMKFVVGDVVDVGPVVYQFF